jgi:hypothetical protein
MVLVTMFFMLVEILDRSVLTAIVIAIIPPTIVGMVAIIMVLFHLGISIGGGG